LKKAGMIALGLAFAGLPSSFRAAAPLYTTYSSLNTDVGTAYQGYIHLYAINPTGTTNAFLYTTTTTGVDISTGTLYTNPGMVYGQPWTVPIVDALGLGFGNRFFMLQSTYPMNWELQASILDYVDDRDCFVISTNGTFLGTAFFTLFVRL